MGAPRGASRWARLPRGSCVRSRGGSRPARLRPGAHGQSAGRQGAWRLAPWGGWCPRRAQGHGWRERARSRPPGGSAAVGRGARAGLPPARALAPTPQRARPRRARALDAAGPAAWVAGARGSGAQRPRRAWWAARPPAAVRTVSGHAEVWRAGRQGPVPTLLAMWEAAAGWRGQAGAGPQGPRGSAGRWRPWAAPWPPPWRWWRVVRRRRRAPTARTASVGGAPAPTPLATVVQVVGRRWPSARCWAEAQGEGGRAQEDVRQGTGWDRLGRGPGGRRRCGRGAARRPGPPPPRATKDRRASPGAV